MMTDKEKQQRTFRRRMQKCKSGFCILSAFLVLFMVWLQVVKYEEYLQKSAAQNVNKRVLQSPRGTIYDRNGKILAISEEAQSLYADPKMITKSPQEIAHILAPYLKIKEPEIEARLQEDTGFVWLEEMMDHDKVDEVKKVVKDQKLTGIQFRKENHRLYPNGSLASQLLGFVNKDDEGMEGLELVLDKKIRGSRQTQLLRTDTNKIPIFNSVLERILPDKERAVQLTIDSTVQYIAEKSLDNVMKRNRPEGAAIIIMDPKTGEILAMASRPNFDPNEYYKGNADKYKNRAVVNTYEPGSTFKPIMAAAAVDSGKWDIHRVYHDVGHIQVADRTFYNWDKRGLGNVTLTEILKFSINTGMVELGLTTGGETLTEYAERFGFGRATGIELPGEQEGILFDPKNMSPVDVAAMSFGQSIAVTPLQMVQAFGALANKGHMMKPFLVKEIDNPDGSVYEKTEPKEVGQPISENTAQTISKILSEEINSGGGQSAKVDGYTFCGKTGTAQRINHGRAGYAEGQYIASFMGFGPLEDPQYVVLIVVDNPSGVFYGAQVAAPVFKDMMTEIVHYKGMRPSQPIERQLAQLPKEAPEKQYVIPAVQHNSDGILIPSFMGWDTREVNDWLDSANLGFVPNGTGRAVHQDPPAGMYAAPGSNVKVTFMR